MIERKKSFRQEDAHHEARQDHRTQNHAGRGAGPGNTASRVSPPAPCSGRARFFTADYAKPEGLCDEAWKAIYQYVFALAHGAGEELFYYGDWIRRKGVAICSCNDGLRPVIFKLEATQEESRIDYTPVR